MHGWKHSFRILSEINSLGDLPNLQAATTLLKLWHSVWIALWQMRPCLKVGSTHLQTKLFGVVGPARSLILRRWIETVLGLLHCNSLHIVLVATSFQQDTSLGKFVLESVSVVVQAAHPVLLGESRFSLRSVLAALTELDCSDGFGCRGRFCDLTVLPLPL